MTWRGTVVVISVCWFHPYRRWTERQNRVVCGVVGSTLAMQPLLDSSLPPPSILFGLSHPLLVSRLTNRHADTYASSTNICTCVVRKKETEMKYVLRLYEYVYSYGIPRKTTSYSLVASWIAWWLRYPRTILFGIGWVPTLPRGQLERVEFATTSNRQLVPEWMNWSYGQEDTTHSCGHAYRSEMGSGGLNHRRAVATRQTVAMSPCMVQQQ